jgi:hypothetical protein
MPDFLQSAAAVTLLARAEDARKRVTELDPGSAEQREAARELDGIYAELGMELHTFSRMSAGAVSEMGDDDADTLQRSLADLVDLEEDDTDPPTLKADEEITVQRRMEDLIAAGLGQELTMPNMHIRDGVDTATDAGIFDENTATGELSDGGYVQSVLTSGPSAEPPRVAKALPHVQSSGWVGQLRDLMSTMMLPSRWDDAVEVATEAAVVQWSTADLDEKWRAYPPAIQIALIGLVSSRARFLEERLAVPAPPRAAIERLRAFRRAHKLSPVVGLLADRGPEHASWDADARHWWGVLVDGIAA